MTSATRGRRILTRSGIVVVAFAAGAGAGALATDSSTQPRPLGGVQARLQAPDGCDRVLAEFNATIPSTASWEYRCTTFAASYLSRPLTEPHACRDEGGRPDGTWQERFFSVPSLCRHTRVVRGQVVRFTGDRTVGYLPDIPPPTSAHQAMRRWSARIYRDGTRALPGRPAPKETTR